MSFDGRLLAGVGVLAAVIESGNFVRASETMGLSPSGVSRAIGRLEARVGIRLLERTTRTVALTDEGRRFYEQVAPLLTGIEEAAIDASGSSSAVRGRLRVNVDPFFSRLVLAGHLASFLDRYPDISLELITRDHVGDLVADGVDVAMRFGEPTSASLVSRSFTLSSLITRRFGSPCCCMLAPSAGHDVPARPCIAERGRPPRAKVTAGT